MRLKTVAGITLTLLFIGMLTLAFDPQPVKASGTIYIKADGSIDPPTSNITSVDNITYTFTDNIYDSIVVERDNITVDGAGYTLQGTGNGIGITLPGRSNVTIKNTTIKNWTRGIITAYSSGNTITNNTVTSNGEHGILLYEYSCDNNITSNTVTSNEYAGIVMLSYCNNNTVSGNEVTLNQKTGIVAQSYSSSNTITSNTVTSNDQWGIVAYIYSSSNTISNNTVTSNSLEGIITVLHSNNNTVSGNDVTLNGGNGIQVHNYSCYNIISNNTVTSNDQWGILLSYYSSGNIISNNTVTSNGYDGIVLGDYSNSNMVTDNTATNNSLHGMSIRISGGNTLRDNNMSDNQYGFSVYSDLNRVLDYIQDIDISNTVDGKPVYYWVNQHDRQIPADAGCVFAVNCVNITVEDLNLTKNGVGVRFVNTPDSTIRNVTALNNTIGIHLILSSGNTIGSSTITSLGFYHPWQDSYFGPPGWLSGYGIGLWNSSGNTVSGNTITNSDYGSDYGIGIGNSSGNTMSGNTITNNDLGIALEDSSSNTIYHNNFVNNTVQANVTSGHVNTWDDCYPSGGNYWSNYKGTDLYSGPYQNETGGDGIGDTPYEIDVNNTDRYPFVHSDMQVIIHYIRSYIGEATTSYNDTDPGYGTRIYSGASNVSVSTPDVDGVRNLTIPLESGYSNPVYDPISNTTVHSFSISHWHGKLYTVDGTGDVDIKSMTDDTGTFFWKDGAWHPPAEEWLGDGTPDPAGSAWLTGVLNISVYHGNGTDGLLLGSWVEQFWVTTGYSENTVVEPNSRLNGFEVNATGVPFSPPYVGSVGTWVYTHAKLNIPFWQGKHYDVQGWTEQLTAAPPAFMATLFSPANLYVTDPVNRHIGAHPTTGEPVNEIPGAFYSGPGSHPQRIVIPDPLDGVYDIKIVGTRIVIPDPLDGVYDIKIVGTSTGEYTLVVELATVENITAHTYTGNISVGETWESQADISEGEMTSPPPSPATPVGGISLPVNKLELLAPYIGLIKLLAVAVVTVGYVKKRKRDTEINS